MQIESTVDDSEFLNVARDDKIQKPLFVSEPIEIGYNMKKLWDEVSFSKKNMVKKNNLEKIVLNSS